jgi:hypothetical protein
VLLERIWDMKKSVWGLYLSVSSRWRLQISEPWTEDIQGRLSVNYAVRKGQVVETEITFDFKYCF